MKKLFTLLACIAVCLFTVTVACACADKPEEDTDKTDGSTYVEDFDKTTILYLGDSICEGVLGPTPIAEREGFSYYSVVGQRNGYRFINRSVSGMKTAPFFEYVSRDDDGATLNKTLISTADIIHISILGNDLLQNDVQGLLVDLVKNDTARMDGILADTKINIANSVAKLKELNPTALIIFQNVYNPLFAESVLVDSATKAKLDALNVDPSEYRYYGSLMLTKLNSILTDYLSVHPDDFVLMDTYSEFDRIFTENAERGKTLFFPDHIHPSNFGHSVIADLTQKILEEKGLADKDAALAKYKEMRIAQIDRIYKDSVDVADLTAKINASTSCFALSQTYFDEVKNATAKVTADTIIHREPTTAYKVSEEISLSFDEDSRVLDYNIASLLNENGSGITLYPDGTITIDAVVSSKSVGWANTLIGTLTNNVDLDGVSHTYLETLFTGFSFDDFEGSFELINTSVCLSVLGIDFDDPAIQDFCEALKTERKIPSGFQLPLGFGIRLEGKYYLKDVKGADGRSYVGLYIGNNIEDTEPFLVFTLGKNEDGLATVHGRVEFMNLELNATERR